MKRTILTPERKAVRKEQESKWYGGYAGAATSWPYRVKRYLSKELSDKIRAEVQAKCDEWIAKLESVKPSKRVIKGIGHWCTELDHQWCCVDRYEDNAIPTQVLGHKVYVRILDSYRKKNGQLGIKPMEKPELEISRYFNKPKGGDWHTYGDQLNFEIRWSEEKQLYFVAEYHRAQSETVDTSRRNWGRTRARKIFMNEVAKLEDSLTNAGFQIGELKNTRNTIGWKHGLEDQYIACTGPEVMA